jgi:SAM-dependent methyltransferase
MMPIAAETISNDLAGQIAQRWPGIAPAEFERRFVEIVEAAAPDRLDAWTAFYRNTLDALASGGAPGGTNAEMAPVHERAAALAVGRDVVELGCCFGFLSLRLAAAGHRVTAVDLAPGTSALLASVAPRLGAPVRALAADALRVPLADRCVDTVFAVHLLEHLPVGQDVVVLAEMLRLTRRRAVVAVPFEDAPNSTWGHVRTFDVAALDALGAASGRRYRVDEHHGGWLVVEC